MTTARSAGATEGSCQVQQACLKTALQIQYVQQLVRYETLFKPLEAFAHRRCQGDFKIPV
ncbi:MAG: hypothetical protein ETSY2_22330 [Candidatus Entotheonella gemina]|uniref:Uncharacterized protein n=1 Tax=Candidatus Entotheonella gemina TaxID=1429439 RepID=W4M5B8_9BACT|nr:MAG: hypothetical protein ETSY2_22330 [Candidatus Entotheonella gemina]